MDEAGGRLHLFRADLLQEGSFDAAVDGCHCVFHTASPVLPDAEDPQVCLYYRAKFYTAVSRFEDRCMIDAEFPIFFFFFFQAELIDPALKGTLNVLSSCKKASVERVILTSSMAAVRVNGLPRTPDVVVDETWFSSPEVCKKEQVFHNSHANSCPTNDFAHHFRTVLTVPLQS
jgi:nucleoside-diphosphate-sugar epimerase